MAKSLWSIYVVRTLFTKNLWSRRVCISKLVPRFPPVPYKDEWGALLVLDWSIKKLNALFFFCLLAQNIMMWSWSITKTTLIGHLFCVWFTVIMKVRKSEVIFFRTTWWTFKQTWLKFKEFFWNNPKKNLKRPFCYPDLGGIGHYLNLFISLHIFLEGKWDIIIYVIRDRFRICCIL